MPPSARPLSLPLWLSKLDAWIELNQTMSRDQATGRVFVHDFKASAWCNAGVHWMESIPVDKNNTRALLEYIQEGHVNPVDVLSKLTKQSFQYQYYDGKFDMDGGVFLDYAWVSAVGNALLVHCIDLDRAHHKHFVRGGLNLFRWPSDKLMVGDQHGVWVQTMCETYPWFREAVVEWLLDGQAADKPAWPWAFDDSLLQSPSEEFVETMMVGMDRHKGLYGIEGMPTAMVQNFQDQVTSLRHHAPAVYHALEAAHNTYTALYGAPAGAYHKKVTEHRTPTVMPLLRPCLGPVDLDTGSLLGAAPGVV